MMALHAPNLKSLSFCYWKCFPGDLVPIGESLPNLEELYVHAVQGPQEMVSARTSIAPYTVKLTQFNGDSGVSRNSVTCHVFVCSGSLAAHLGP